ncbi:HAD-IIIA family hydrolase [Paraburkholderia sp. A3BS-1L]|uniref:HAD-IIIA family hydrolase n=1 Tax=Paraburkholderia sp. A3BS-1L TaxID=3028375 RepID=UPI003DA7F644
MVQAVILAGGKGTRLAERLKGRPKPLVDVCGVPLLERQINALTRYGVDDVVVLVNHAADQIQAFFDDRQFTCSVRLIDDGEPRGTAGALLACLDELADRFLVVYGDTLFDIDVGCMLAAHEASSSKVTLLLHPNDHPADSDLVELDESGRIVAFHGYPHPQGAELRNLVNAAFYVIEKEALLPWQNFSAPCDFGKDLFPAMLAAGTSINGYASFEYIKDLGTPKRLDKAETHLRTGVVERASRKHLQKAIFIDRDGTLNVLRDYIRHPEDLTLLPGAAEAVRHFNDSEYRVVVVTNQPVIARGECSVEGLRKIHDRLENRLGEAGAYVDALYYCPHHPDAGFPGEVTALKMVCNCRKPAIGMIRQAIDDMNISSAKSWMIGDSTADVLAAQRAGLRSILVATGEGGADGKYSVTPNFRCQDIRAAAKFIVEIYPRLVDHMSAMIGEIRPGDLIFVGGRVSNAKSVIAEVLKAELSSRGVRAQLLPADRWLIAQEHPGSNAADSDTALAALEGWLNGEAAEIEIPATRDKQGLAPSNLSVAADDVLILESVTAFRAEWQKCRRTRYLYVESTRTEQDHSDFDLLTGHCSSNNVDLIALNQKYANEFDIVKAASEYTLNVDLFSVA